MRNKDLKFNGLAEIMLDQKNRLQLKQLIYMSLDFDDITDEPMLKYGQ